jgi:hypothetical protein
VVVCHASYLVNVHQNHLVRLAEVDLVALLVDEPRDGVDDVVPLEGGVVADGWADCELVGVALASCYTSGISWSGNQSMS